MNCIRILLISKCFYRSMKNEGKDLEEGRCLRGGDRRLGFIEKDWAKVWKEHMETITNEENEWDHKVETNVIEKPMEKVVCYEMWKNAKDGIKKGNWTI